MQAIRVGILGAARITPKAVLAPAQVLPSVEIVACAARDRARAEAFASKHAIETVYDDYAALVTSPGVGLIYNPLPINHHAEWTIKALEAGKHVLCEKPFAMNLGEAKAMLDAAKTSGKRLIEAFHHRYHPAFETCLNWVRSGKIGDVRKIDAVFKVHIKDNGQEIRHRVETGGGSMMDLGCYPLHWALAVIGSEPEKIEAKADLTPTGVDERMQAELTFSGGASARLESSMAAGEAFQAGMTITGTKGEIAFNNPLAPQLGASLSCSDGSIAEISPITTYTWQMAAILRALGTGETLPTEGDIILRQQDALDGIYAAAGLKHLR